MLDILNCFTATLTTNVLHQHVTTVAASTNYIDLTTANVKLGVGKPLFLIVRVLDAFTPSTATSMSIQLETDTDSGFATALKQIMDFNIANANLTAGKVVVCVPLPVQKYQEFMRLYFKPVGGDVTYSAGSFVAYLSDTPEDHESQIDIVAN